MSENVMKKANEIVLTLCFSIGFSACTNRTINTVSDTSVNTPAMQQEAQLATQEGAHVISRIQFDQGRSTLTPGAQEELRKAVEQARSMGEVDEITVAVWSDMEYPTRQKKLSKTQLDLADKRADEVERFLDRNFDVDEIRVHNMAKQPNALSQILSTPDADLKQRLVSSGMVSDQESGQMGRASSALIMVEVE